MPAYRPMPLHLETRRLILRPWAKSDAASYRALAGERGKGPVSVERSHQVVGEQMATPGRTGIALLVVERRGEDGFLGYCGLLVGRASIDEPEIGYELFRHAHGQGYATEAATAVLDAAAGTGRRRIWATVGTWNAPSLRVLEKLGFHRDRVTTDDQGDGLAWLTRTLP